MNDDLKCCRLLFLLCSCSTAITSLLGSWTTHLLHTISHQGCHNLYLVNLCRNIILKMSFGRRNIILKMSFGRRNIILKMSFGRYGVRRRYPSQSFPALASAPAPQFRLSHRSVLPWRNPFFPFKFPLFLCRRSTRRPEFHCMQLHGSSLIQMCFRSVTV
jgi:hypothetical protein